MRKTIERPGGKPKKNRFHARRTKPVEEKREPFVSNLAVRPVVSRPARIRQRHDRFTDRTVNVGRAVASETDEQFRRVRFFFFLFQTSFLRKKTRRTDGERPDGRTVVTSRASHAGPSSVCYVTVASVADDYSLKNYIDNTSFFLCFFFVILK